MLQRKNLEKIMEEEGRESLEQARLEAERSALEAARKRVDQIKEEADSLLKQGYFRQAIPKYNQVMAEGENIAYPEALIEALKKIARCYFSMGYFEVAHSYMQKAASKSVLTRAEENFLDTLNRKLWDKEGKRRRAEGF